MNYEEWLESLTYAQCCALASQVRVENWLSIPPDKIRARLEQNEDAESVYERNN